MPERTTSVAQDMRRLAFSVYLPSFFNAIARGGALVLLPLYALETDGGAVVAGAILSLRALGTMIADVPAGQLTAKIGDKAVMLGGLAIVGTTAILASFSGSPLSLGVVAVGFGLGSGAWILGRLSNITENVILERRGRVISVLAGLERAGQMIGPVSAGLAVEQFGYAPVFVMLGCLSLGAFVLVATFAQRTKLRTVSHIEIGARKIIGKHAGTFARCGSIMVCLSLLRNSRALIIPVWGTAIGLGPAEIGLVMSLTATVDLMMFYPAGLILDHIGRKAALVPAMSIMSVALVLLPWTDSFATFLLVSLLGGLGNGFGTGIFMTIGGDLAPRFGRSQFLGVWRLIGDSGGAAGPGFIGTLAQTFTMAIACSAAGLIGIFGAIAALLVIPETTRR
ncbi:MAG: MFS transporter [Gammaproteobacteria bacterium]|nr:MFS transporter [Gammaproteobacteria bacterium]